MDTLGAILGLLAFVGLTWGMIHLTGKQSNAEHDRKLALAWKFLTWTDEDVEQYRQALLSKSGAGGHASELEALAMSRQMRLDLRGDLLSHRPAGRA
jgi:hypothetical protein